MVNVLTVWCLNTVRQPIGCALKPNAVALISRLW